MVRTAILIKNISNCFHVTKINKGKTLNFHFPQSVINKHFRYFSCKAKALLGKKSYSYSTDLEMYKSLLFFFFFLCLFFIAGQPNSTAALSLHLPKEEGEKIQ